jgi:RNA polymerase sigma factor (sigma-70 family)
MSSKGPKQTQTLRELLEDPDLQRRAHAWAESLVQRYMLAPMTAEDLYQEAMTKLVRYANSEQPREISYPKAFLFKVLRNQARTLSDNQARPSFRILHIEGVEYDEVPSQKLSDNLDMVQRMESGILLKEACRDFDEEEKALVYCVLSGYTLRQIAAVFKISHVTAANRVAQLKNKMRKALL